MKKPANTTKQAQCDPAMQGWVMGGNPSAIEAQEAQGQRELAASDVLPSECEGREALAALGLVFGDPVPDDPLFQSVILPAGWRKVPTEHAMWTDLVDAQDVKRAAIFYKAAFYDRRAFMRAE